MAVNKKYHKKIKEGFKDIFKTEVHNGGQSSPYGSLNDLSITITNPLVKHQIILLAKLCEEIPVSVFLKSSGNKIYIEFWENTN
jgi:hypothetical protein